MNTNELSCKFITLTNTTGMNITLLDLGATWVSCQMVLASGELQEVLLGCSSVQDFMTQKAYLGATVGRYANRIKNSTIQRAEKIYHLVENEGVHQLHGGPNGFSQRRWEITHQEAQQVTFTMTSADGDQGFPGNMQASVTYTLTNENCVEIEYVADVDQDCPINMTNHAYFNLDGDNTDARQQSLMIDSELFLPVDSTGIPNGELCHVTSSPSMDFRQPKQIIRDFLQGDEQRAVQGYDHAYLLHTDCSGGSKPAARLISSDGQRIMEVFTDKPAIQLYSGNHLSGTPARNGHSYQRYAGIALETQFLPDSPNHPEWPQPDCWIAANQTYQSKTVYRFSANSLL